MQGGSAVDPARAAFARWNLPVLISPGGIPKKTTRNRTSEASAAFTVRLFVSDSLKHACMLMVQEVASAARLDPYHFRIGEGAAIGEKGVIPNIVQIQLAPICRHLRAVHIRAMHVMGLARLELRKDLIRHGEAEVGELAPQLR